MSFPIATLPLDYSGSESSNLITGEIHAVGLHKLIVPMYGAFHKKDLVVNNLTTALPLTDDQFMIVDMYQDATVIAGDTEIYSAIVITDNTVTGNVAIDYQALGGPYCKHNQKLIDWLTSRQINTGTLDWPEVFDVPKRFAPSHHLHLLAHVYGMEYVVDALKRVEEAILTGSGPIYDEFLENVLAKLENIRQKAHLAVDEMVLQRFNSFKSLTNAEGIGLGLLMNAGIMTRDQATAIADPGFNSREITTEQYVAISSLDAFYEAFYEKVVSRQNTNLDLSVGVEVNPTKPNILSLVNGTVVTLPSKKRAVAEGREIDTYVYPPGVSENDEYVVFKINGNQFNYGGVYMSINKTSLDTYVGTMVNDGCDAKFFWNKMLFDGELDPLKKLIADHLVDYKNPHEVDKFDIELGKVENLPVITEDEIINDKSARKYLTLDTMMYYAKKFLTNAKPPPLPGETLDPNAKTMDQCQIIFNTCKKEAELPPNWPTKGQLIRTFCDQTDKMARYTDGSGGFYDDVFELNAIDCGFIVHPKRGELINSYCGGDSEAQTDKIGVYANGDGTSYESLIKKNDPDCGYEKPPILPEGTVMAVFCTGVPGEQKTRYADGNDGFTELVTGTNVAQCGGSGGTGNPPGPTPSGTSGPPPAAGTVISTSCVGTTKRTVYADGNGGTYNIDVENHADCANQPPGPTPDPIGGSERYTGVTMFGWLTNHSLTATVGENREMLLTGYGYVPGKDYYFRIEARDPSTEYWVPIKEKYAKMMTENIQDAWGTIPLTVAGYFGIRVVVAVKGSEGYQYRSPQTYITVS